MLAGLAEAGPVEDVGDLPDPLVGHHLAAAQHGAAAVQHRHVAPAVLVQVVPQHSRALLRPDVETVSLRECFVRVPEDFTITEKAPARAYFVTSVRVL